MVVIRRSPSCCEDGGGSADVMRGNSGSDTVTYATRREPVTREQIEAVLDFVAESGDQFRCTRRSRSANRGSVRIGSNSGAVFNV